MVGRRGHDTAVTGRPAARVCRGPQDHHGGSNGREIRPLDHYPGRNSGGSKDGSGGLATATNAPRVRVGDGYPGRRRIRVFDLMAAEAGGWQHGVAWSRMVAGMGEHPGVRVIDGRELKITTPGRVLYPATGTTKTVVLDFYAAVAPVMLPHLTGRPATRKRWPECVRRARVLRQGRRTRHPGLAEQGADPAPLRAEVLPGVRHPRRAGLARAGRRPRTARPAMADPATSRTPTRGGVRDDFDTAVPGPGGVRP